MGKYINPFSKTAENLAMQFDEATVNKDADKLKHLIEEALEKIDTYDDASQAQIFYCIGTVLSVIDSISGVVRNEDSYEKQIYYFRRSIEIIEKSEFNRDEYVPYIVGFKCNLYTNYANALNQTGRMVAAIEQYNLVLSVNPSFGMAFGSLGKAYQFYGRLVSDPGHQLHLHHYAYACLSKAVNSDDPNMYDAAKAGFKGYMEQYAPEYIEKILSAPLDIRQFEYSDKNELVYREWVLKNGLFLNPLNDLPYIEFAYATDSLQLPPITTSIDVDKPIFHEMFNQLKQEYIFARFQYYSALKEPDIPHFADKDTHILNLLDYQQYSIRVEQIKSSFRTLYSLFDKVAFFINEYFGLGIRKKDVSFSSIWLSEKRGKDAYKYANSLNVGNNYAIDSLHWIRKDFYRKFHKSPYPQAKRVSDIRHALEHRYTKVYWDLVIDATTDIEDELAITVSEEELKKETLRLLKLVREVIICLSLSVGIEEHKKNKDEEGKLSMSVPLFELKDEWKL